MYHHKKTAFGGLSLTADDHRKEALMLARRFAGYFDKFNISSGPEKVGYAITAIMVFGQLTQAEIDAEVPPLSISRDAAKQLTKVSEYLLRAR